MDIPREIEATTRELGTRRLDERTARVAVLTRTYPTDVDDLWSACTDPARLERWFLPVHGDLHVGGRYQIEGQAGGLITACRTPHALDATWEYGGETSWIELRLGPDGTGARLELRHVFHTDDEHWLRYGPAATGIGWDLGLVGLAWHLDAGGTPHGESAEWAASREGVAFLGAAGDAWVPVSVAAGLDPDDARARTDRDPAHLPNWLRGLVRHEPLRGEHGQVCTESRVVMRMGGQEMEGTETITRREPADLHRVPSGAVVHFERELVADGMWNAARERLTEAGPDATLWVSENEYRFSRLPMRLLMPFLRGAFRRQTLQHMQDFKAFAEHGTDVRDTTV